MMVCDTFDTACALEIAKTLPGFFTAGAAIFGAWVAKKGLDKWKVETVGKRRAELAEQTLVLVYEARDVLKLARSSGLSHTRTPAEDESPVNRELLDRLHSPIELLIARSELFAKLHTQTYPFAAVFGQESVQPLRDLISLREEIWHAAITLSSQLSAGSFSPEAPQMSAAIFGKVGDEFDTRLNEAVESIEQICRKALTSEERPAG